MARFVDERFDTIANALSILTYTGFSEYVGAGGAAVGTDAGRIRHSGSTVNSASVVWARTLPASANYTVGARFFVASGGFSSSDPTMGISGRVDDVNNNGYYFRANPTSGWGLFRFDGGTFTQLGSSVAQTWTASTSYEVELILSGSTISAKVDGVEVISVTDSTYSAAGRAGLRSPGGSTGSNTTGIHIDRYWGDDGVARPQLFDWASVPANGGSNASTAATITPPAGMSSGQLAVIVSQHRGSGVTFAMGVTGGQTWSRIALGGAESLELHWCQFSGTWAANPRVDATGATTAITHILLVFDASATSGRTWSVDTAPTLESMATSPYTLTGFTPSAAMTLNLAIWAAPDDCSWNLSDEEGWQHPGMGYIQNLSGSDLSIHAEFNVLTSAALLTSPSSTQQTNGPDPSTGFIISFADTAAAVAAAIPPNRYRFISPALLAR